MRNIKLCNASIITNGPFRLCGEAFDDPFKVYVNGHTMVTPPITSIGTSVTAGAINFLADRGVIERLRSLGADVSIPPPVTLVKTRVLYNAAGQPYIQGKDAHGLRIVTEVIRVMHSEQSLIIASGGAAYFVPDDDFNNIYKQVRGL